jgi:serine/threonine protein kinase
MRSKQDAGTYCYLAIESLKEKEYSKMSDIFAVGATIFEWDTHEPFIYARVGKRDDIPFYIDVQEKGRILENEQNGVITFLKDEKGAYKRESLTGMRTEKSRFKSVLDKMCHLDKNKRPSAKELLASDELISCILTIRDLAKDGT